MEWSGEDGEERRGEEGSNQGLVRRGVDRRENGEEKSWSWLEGSGLVTSTSASANRARRIVIVGDGVGPGPPYNEVERTRRAGEDLYRGLGVVDQLAINSEQQIACQTRIT